MCEDFEERVNACHQSGDSARHGSSRTTPGGAENSRGRSGRTHHRAGRDRRSNERRPRTYAGRAASRRRRWCAGWRGTWWCHDEGGERVSSTPATFALSLSFRLLDVRRTSSIARDRATTRRSYRHVLVTSSRHQELSGGFSDIHLFDDKFNGISTCDFELLVIPARLCLPAWRPPPRPCCASSTASSRCTTACSPSASALALPAPMVSAHATFPRVPGEIPQPALTSDRVWASLNCPRRYPHHPCPSRPPQATPAAANRAMETR